MKFILLTTLSHKDNVMDTKADPEGGAKVGGLRGGLLKFLS